MEDSLAISGVILECIERALDSFGQNVRLVLYWKMERELGLRRENIPFKPELFAKSVERMFGPGSRIVERVITREIEKSSGVAMDDMVSAIIELKRALERG